MFCVRWALLGAGLLACSRLPAGDTPPAPPPETWAWSGDAAGLHRLSMSELDDLYRRSTVRAMPQGYLPGEVIVFTNMPAPRLVKKLADRNWMGKHIEPDGSFINQWRKGQALSSQLVMGPSYVDGQPSLVFEYPRWTPLFGPMRDEYREIAPGLYLGRMYRRVPHVRFLGFNYLKLNDAGQCETGVLARVDQPTADEPAKAAAETGAEVEATTVSKPAAVEVVPEENPPGTIPAPVAPATGRLRLRSPYGPMTR